MRASWMSASLSTLKRRILCLRIKQAGWEVRHLPDLTILHHAGKAGWNPRVEAQGAYAKQQYMRKHFSFPRRLAATAALAFGYGLRAVAWQAAPVQRECARAALGTLLGRRPPPFGEPPSVALRPEGPRCSNVELEPLPPETATRTPALNDQCSN